MKALVISGYWSECRHLSIFSFIQVFGSGRHAHKYGCLWTHSFLKKKRCKLSHEILCVHQSMQQKADHLRRWGWAKLGTPKAMLTASSFRITICPASSLTLCDSLWGHQSDHTSDKLVWGLIASQLLEGVRAHTHTLHIFLFQGSLVAEYSLLKVIVTLIVL